MSVLDEKIKVYRELKENALELNRRISVCRAQQEILEKQINEKMTALGVNTREELRSKAAETVAKLEAEIKDLKQWIGAVTEKLSLLEK